MNKTTILLCLAILPACSEFNPPPDLARQLEAPPAADLAPAARTDQPDLPTPLTIDQALAIAWRGHPQMDRARHLIRARHGFRGQAALWPNPVAGAIVLEEPDKKTQMTVTLAQKFEIGGKADSRVSVAAANIFLSEAGLIEVWSDLRSEIKDAFVRLAYARSNRSLTEKIAAVDTERLDLAMGLFKAGKASESETLKLTRQAARSQTAFEQSASLIEDASRGVLIAIGRRPDRKALDCACSLDVDSPLADEFDALVKDADKGNPQLNTARAQTVVARARLRLARTKQWSDVTVGLGYRRTDYDDSDGANAVRLEVSAPLPIWDRNQGNIAAARERIDASDRQQQAAALIAARQLSQLLAQRRRWRMELKSLDERIIPAAARELKLIRDALAGGKASKLDALKLSREFMSLDLRRLELRLMAAAATIQLENITGVAVSADRP